MDKVDKVLARKHLRKITVNLEKKYRNENKHKQSNIYRRHKR